MCLSLLHLIMFVYIFLHYYGLSLQVCILHVLLYDCRGLQMHACAHGGHGHVAGSTTAHARGMF